MREIPAGVVISRTDAIEAGWSDGALRRAVTAGRLIRLRPGYFCAPPVTAQLAADAATRACFGSVASHRFAAALHGLPMLGPSTWLPQVTVPPSARGSLSGANLHRATMSEQFVTSCEGVPTTTIARTVADLGRQYGVASAVVPLDFALHHHLVTEAELFEVLLACWTWPGIRKANRAVSLADARAESPLESLSRLVLRRLGIPPPTLQLEVADERGAFVGRADFGWEERGVVGEADGLGKYAEREILRAEKERQERLEQLGLVVVRWNWTDVTQRPLALKQRVNRAFERADSLRRSGVPRYWSVRAGRIQSVIATAVG